MEGRLPARHERSPPPKEAVGQRTCADQKGQSSMTQKLNAAEKMLAGKRRLIKRLKSDINWEQKNAAENIEKIQARIRIAQTLVDALEKGTLRP
jgi:hypothetical protein